MPAAKRNTETTPDAPPVAALEKGEHNAFLQGIINDGQEAEAAIKSWYVNRDNLRQQARMAVAAGFASPEQAETVGKLWPMPKRKKKGEADSTEETPATETTNA